MGEITVFPILYVGWGVRDIHLRAGFADLGMGVLTDAAVGEEWCLIGD